MPSTQTLLHHLYRISWNVVECACMSHCNMRFYGEWFKEPRCIISLWIPYVPHFRHGTHERTLQNSLQTTTKTTIDSLRWCVRSPHPYLSHPPYLSTKHTRYVYSNPIAYIFRVHVTQLWMHARTIRPASHPYSQFSCIATYTDATEMHVWTHYNHSIGHRTKISV